MKRMILRLRRGFKRASDALVGKLAIIVLGGLRLIDADKMADFAGGLMRTIGPLLPGKSDRPRQPCCGFSRKIQRSKLIRSCAAAGIILAAWAAEFAHLDRLWNFDPEQSPNDGRIELAQPDIDRFLRLLNDGKPALIFRSPPCQLGAAGRLCSNLQA